METVLHLNAGLKAIYLQHYVDSVLCVSLRYDNV